MADYIKLDEAPHIEFRSPVCGACHVDLIAEDGYLCPVCGTAWGWNDGDGDPGTLYESWSGEKLDVESTPEDQAWRIGYEHERMRRDALIRSLTAPETQSDGAKS